MNRGPHPSVDRPLDATMRREIQALRQEIVELRSRLDEPEEIIRAIRQGEVDAFVVTSPSGDHIYSLRSADALYRSMVEEMREGAVALDASGVVLYCNNYFATMVKVERSALRGTSILPYVPASARPMFDTLRTDADAASTSRAELSLCRADGTRVPILVTMNRITVEGGDPVFCLIVTDLTVELRRAQLATESRRKDAFLAMLAHELRNPMASIRAAVDSLALGGLPEEQVGWTLSMMGRQVTQLTRLIDDLLDVSRITRGQIHLDMRPLDLATAVSRGVETANAEIVSRGHELRVDLEQGHLRVMGDGVRLAQVISNLVHNAAKFTPDGGHVAVRVEERDGEARVIVTDDGVGIDESMFETIFDSFSQVDASLERRHGGLGLGLALVRTIMDMHHGRVEVASDGVGTGSTFVVALPILPERAPEREGSDRSRPEKKKKRAPVSPRRVLIVDDNIDAGETLSMLLGRLGHEVRFVTHGREAAPAVKELQPQLVLLDIGLPDMSGYEVAEELALLAERSRFRLVALTGYGQEQDRERSREAGFDEHWVKPIDLAVLKSYLASLPGDEA